MILSALDGRDHRSLSEDFGLTKELDLICERGNGGCFERLLVPNETYQAVRRFPTRFIVKLGHAADRVERVVEELPEFLVVERSAPTRPQRSSSIRAGTATGREHRRERALSVAPVGGPDMACEVFVLEPEGDDRAPEA